MERIGIVMGLRVGLVHTGNMVHTSHEDMVLIPAGEFEMGSNIGVIDEKPVHSVYLDAFYIDKYEITVSQYQKCLNAGKCKGLKTGESYNLGKSGRQNHPVNGVDWNNATAFCRFVGKRLPTEAEWEKAATWKNKSKSKYPSGKSSVSCADAVMTENTWWGCGKNQTWPVGSKPQEINGTHDMAGNVWEWVSDWYSDYSVINHRSPKGPSSGSHRVIRGGSWDDDNASDLRGASRSSHAPSIRDDSIGFRCASSP